MEANKILARSWW